MDRSRASPDRKPDGARSIWSQLMSKYTPSGNYPLGMTSGLESAQAGDRPDSTTVWHPYELKTSEPPRAVDKTAPDLADLILDANVMQALENDRPSTMSIKSAAILHDDPLEDYKMTSKPRGYCLIVNNVDFEHDLFPKRRGSDQDAIRFDQLFSQLGFETIMTRNLTADQMRSKFKELAAACRLEHDALFVFILSHGSETGIYGTDGFEVYLESEIISCFNNRNCTAMAGKPKVFVIQACRGSSNDFGGDTTDAVATMPAGMNHILPSSPATNMRVPASWLPSLPKQPLDDPHCQQRPILTDMLVVFSCLAGYVSVRNETAGSWLGVALAYFIMTHAHEKDLMKILNLVSNDIIQRKSTRGHFQSVELKLLGWTKNLYFNTGIYR